MSGICWPKLASMQTLFLGSVFPIKTPLLLCHQICLVALRRTRFEKLSSSMSKKVSEYYGFLARLPASDQISMKSIEKTRKKLDYAHGSSPFLHLLTPLCALVFIQRAQTNARVLWIILNLGGAATTSQIWLAYGKTTTHQHISRTLRALKRDGILVRERASSKNMKQTAARWTVNSPALIEWFGVHPQKTKR